MPRQRGITPQRTFRIPDETWFKALEEGKRRGTTASALVQDFVAIIANKKDIVQTTDEFRTLFTEVQQAWERILHPTAHGRGPKAPLMPMSQRPRPPLREKPLVDQTNCPHTNLKEFVNFGTFCGRCGKKIA